MSFEDGEEVTRPDHAQDSKDSLRKAFGFFTAGIIAGTAGAFLTYSNLTYSDQLKQEASEKSKYLFDTLYASKIMQSTNDEFSKLAKTDSNFTIVNSCLWEQWNEKTAAVTIQNGVMSTPAIEMPVDLAKAKTCFQNTLINNADDKVAEPILITTLITLGGGVAGLAALWFGAAAGVSGIRAAVEKHKNKEAAKPHLQGSVPTSF